MSINIAQILKSAIQTRAPRVLPVNNHRHTIFSITMHSQCSQCALNCLPQYPQAFVTSLSRLMKTLG
jgi:hypothetical protein